MSHSPLEYLRHISDEMAYLEQETQRLNKNTFIQDETIKRAFVRSLEVIGETVKNISVDFRQTHSHIDWRGMAGMRDRLIHGYFGVDYDIVWDVVANKIPLLKLDIQQIMQEEDNG